MEISEQRHMQTNNFSSVPMIEKEIQGIMLKAVVHLFQASAGTLCLVPWSFHHIPTCSTNTRGVIEAVQGPATQNMRHNMQLTYIAFDLEDFLDELICNLKKAVFCNSFP